MSVTTGSPLTVATTPTPTSGVLTHNNAAPDGTNIGAIIALANAAPPSFAEGKQVLLSTDLFANLRIAGSISGIETHNVRPPGAINLGVLSAIATASEPTYIEGNLVALSTDLKGALHTTGSALVDSNNTTTATLNSGATFTGTATDLVGTGHQHIVVTVFADEDSATDGLVIQFSQDGTNWPTGSYKHTFTITANVARTFQLGPEAHHFRVTYTNGGTNQGTFRLTTILNDDSADQTLHRIDDSLDGDRSVHTNKTVLVAKKPNNTYVNIESTNGGNLKVSVEEFDGDPTLRVHGTVAHDSPDADNPLKVGGKARTTNPAAVANNDRVDAYFDDLGRQVVVNNAPRDLVVEGSGVTLNDDTEQRIIEPGAAGVFRDLTHMVVTSTSDLSTRVDIRDAEAGTVSFSLAISNRGGAVIPYYVPKKQTTAQNAWTAQLAGSGVTDVRVSVQAIENV